MSRAVKDTVGNDFILSVAGKLPCATDNRGLHTSLLSPVKITQTWNQWNSDSKNAAGYSLDFACGVAEDRGTEKCAHLLLETVGREVQFLAFGWAQHKLSWAYCRQHNWKAHAVR